MKRHGTSFNVQISVSGDTILETRWIEHVAKKLTKNFHVFPVSIFQIKWHLFNLCNMNLGSTCIKTVYSWSLSASTGPVKKNEKGPMPVAWHSMAFLSWFLPSQFQIQVFAHIPRYQARQSTCDWKHQHLSCKVVRKKQRNLSHISWMYGSFHQKLNGALPTDPLQ